MSKFKGGGGNYKLDLKKKKNYERHLISYNKEIIGALCFNKKKEIAFSNVWYSRKNTI